MTVRTKMTLKVCDPIWDNFNAQIGKLPISRDQFLNNVLKVEAPRLSKAMKGKKLSYKANRWISGQLKKLGTKSINIGLDLEVATTLNEIISESGMVRDAFFNRLIAFLRSTNPLLKHLDLPLCENKQVGRDYVNIEKPVSPLTSLEECLRDPLWYLHMAIQEIHGTSIYLVDFPSQVNHGFACWIAEEDVPRTKANQRKITEQREIFGLL